MVDKYISIYLKRNAWLCLVCALITFTPLFVTSIIYDVIEYDLLIACVPFPIAALIFGLCALPVIRFRKMISRQENMYGVSFSDSGARHLETTLYLADEWLIWAGSCAIYREHIREIRASGSGFSYRVRIRTADNRRYTVWCMDLSNLKKLKNWPARQ